VAELIKEQVPPHFKSISIDGSSWDSTQKSELLDAVDTQFFQAVKDFNTEVLKTHGFNQPERLSDIILRDATKTDLELLVNFAGGDFEPHPDPVKQQIITDF
jgi:hypothetical protein